MSTAKTPHQSIKIKSTKKVLVENCVFAKSAVSRLIGLLNHESLDDNEGLLITPCNQVHTLFMRFPIDAIFLDKNFTVLKIKALPPWRISPLVWGSRSVLEVPLGHSAKMGLQIGDQIEVSPC